MSDVRIRQESGPPGEPVSFQWECRACREYGAWSTDEEAVRADAAGHRCPDIAKQPRSDPWVV